MAEPRNLSDPDAGHSTIAVELAHGYATLRSWSDSARLDAELLLAKTLGQPRSYLRAHPEQTVRRQTIETYRRLLARRSQGEPVAYLTGEREFWSLALHVTPDVLVPRPETELAVERCLALLPQQARAADLGTGSGAIALALASERPQWRIVASDRSQAALAVASANANRLNLRNIEFLAGDWFTPFERWDFNLIVSNPPYVADADPALQRLRYEPAIALTPGATGLEAIDQIVRAARGHLLPAGWLVLEHGNTQASQVAGMLVSAGYARVRCYADLAGHDRVTEAQWP